MEMEQQQQPGIVGRAMQEPQQEEESQQGGAPQDEGLKRVVLAAMKVLYDPKTSDTVVRMLQQGEPATSLAQTALFVMRALYDQSKASIPPALMQPAAASILQLCAELAKAAGVQLTPEAEQQATGLVQQSMAKRFGGQQQQTQPDQEIPEEEAQEPVEEEGE